MELLTTRYTENLAGVLSCYDRIVITGTLPGACFAEGMTSFGLPWDPYLRLPAVRAASAERVRHAAQALATEHGARIEHIAKAHVRKEDVGARRSRRVAMRSGLGT
ncbi:MAG: hypothetical protein IPI02_01085 [Sterolibacteriaceae bacterium]|nr:hypothetical protein [Sterolibacteriaceae bacterium]